MSKWTSENIGDISGKTAIVTGANSGIGFEAAKALAEHGARVILACRSEKRGTEALQAIEAESPKGSVELRLLDLSDLDSVRAFADGVLADLEHIDLLINNAGVMMPPLSRTAQGFELQFGVNHLGHFALTGLLLERLVATPGARIVNVSSQAHRTGKIDFDDLNWESRKYKKVASYGQSKLANLLFTFELQRKLEALGADTKVAAAHPGWTGTNLQQHVKLFEWMNALFAMAPWKGALPTLRAAIDPEAQSGDYFGPRGLTQLNGYPVKVGTTKAAKNEADAARLWEASVALTGVAYEALDSRTPRTSARPVVRA